MNCKLINENFFKLYREYISPGSVNLFLSDLPYNIFTDSRLSGLPNDEAINLNTLELVLDEILHPTGQAVLFCNFDLLIKIRSEIGKYLTLKNHHILSKSMAMPGNKYYPLNDAEYLAVCYKRGSKISDLVFNPYTLTGHPYRKKNYNLDESIIRKQHKPAHNHSTGTRHIRTIIPMQSKCNLDAEERTGIKHPFQKSVKLLRTLIRTYSNSGNLVVDGFAGSASTLIAAHQENRPAIGFEVEKKYYSEAQTRLSRELSQCVLF